jgi:hypothetical protein
MNDHKSENGEQKMETAKRTPGEWEIWEQKHNLSTFRGIRAGNKIVVGATGFTRTQHDESVEVYGPRMTREDAEFVVQACNNFDKLAEALNDLRAEYVNLHTHALQYGAREHTLDAAVRASLVLRAAGIEVQNMKP